MTFPSKALADVRAEAALRGKSRCEKCDVIWSSPVETPDPCFLCNSPGVFLGNEYQYPYLENMSPGAFTYSDEESQL